MWIAAVALYAGCESSTPAAAPATVETMTTPVDMAKTGSGSPVDTVTTTIDMAKNASGTSRNLTIDPVKTPSGSSINITSDPVKAAMPPRRVGKPHDAARSSTTPNLGSLSEASAKHDRIARADRVATDRIAIAPTANRNSVVMVPSLDAPRTSCKPEAPVAVAIASHQLSTNRYELTITATPTSLVDSVVLELVVPTGATADRARASFASTRAGEARVLTAIVTTTAKTTDIAGVARVPVEAGDRGAPIVMSRTTSFVLGAPHAQPVTRTYALPDGERAREVRP